MKFSFIDCYIGFCYSFLWLAPYGIKTRVTFPKLVAKGGKVKEGEFGLTADTKDNYMYVEIPVNFVYYVPVGTGNLFLGAGPYAEFGVSAKSEANGTSQSGSFDEAGLNTFEAGLNFLGGYKLANGFLLNAGYGLGLTNI